MSEARQPACFVVHGLETLRAALAAGMESGRPIVALSAAGASGYAGAPWFAGLIEQGRAEYPDVQLTAILDCADRAGDVMVAFALGLKTIVFNGHPDAAERLKQIGATYGASIIATRPAAFDPPPWRDPSHAARTFIKNL